MKKRIGKILLPFLICMVGTAAVVIGIFYFSFISKRIFEDSSAHLSEIYGQVNRSFNAFAERNWGLLESWGHYISIASDSGDEVIFDFIESEKKSWKFTEFYFLSKDKTGMTYSGTQYTYDTHEPWKLLTEQDQPIMIGRTLSDGSQVTVFAAPVTHGVYKGLSYDAIAISYTNEDLAGSLNVDAFSGKAKCFVIHSDGTVLLSTRSDGNVCENYLEYLRSDSDLDEEELAGMLQDWQDNAAGILRCSIDGIDQIVSYQSVGYQDYMLLSVVPESVVSAGFLSVQKTTVNVLIVIFLLIGISLAAIFILRSHSQSRKNKMELRYRETMFDVLSNSVDDIFIMIDCESSNVDYISPNIEKLLGIPVSEARSDIRVMEKCALVEDVVIPAETLMAVPLNGSISRDYEYMHQNTGERRWYRMTAYRMSIQDVEKYIFVLSDRTQEQQMNRNLREALNAARSANEAKSNFLSNMSHDIRTPMNAIVGFSVLLEKDADQPDKVREYTRKITASGHHMLSLINDVLDMSKIESGKTSLSVDVFSLPELLEELNIILMPQAKAKKQTFRIHVQGAPPEQLSGDKLRLNQILINLLSNALKYTPEGGNIDFTVSELPERSKQYAKFRFVVSDDGIGMSEEFQKNIFSPFSREVNSVTNKIQGTGLGMAITKNLVDLMGGIITLESSPGKGSTFTVELTFAIPEQEDPEKWFRRKISRMLIADDEKDICMDITELMKETGIDILCVNDGVSAVDEAVRAHEEHRDFNVILLDWKMPGTDGVEAARLIREKIGDHIPILVLTSHDWGDIEDEARQAGINAFMSKPFFVSTFLQTIKPLFTDTSAAEENRGDPAGKVLNGCLFLVAEDNELNAEILSEMLKIEGADCELAANGQEAADMFIASEPGHYDMIFMDVQMPVMNGYEATRKIRASSHPSAKTIPIAAMTANTFAEDVRNAMDSGMDGHLAKPIDMNAVKELAGRLLKKNGA